MKISGDNEVVFIVNLRCDESGGEICEDNLSRRAVPGSTKHFVLHLPLHPVQTALSFYQRVIECEGSGRNKVPRILFTATLQVCHWSNLALWCLLAPIVRL